MVAVLVTACGPVANDDAGDEQEQTSAQDSANATTPHSGPGPSSTTSSTSADAPTTGDTDTHDSSTTESPSEMSDECDFEHAHCPPGLACSYEVGFGFYCVEAECIVDADCAAGQECFHGNLHSEGGECLEIDRGTSSTDAGGSSSESSTGDATTGATE